MIIPTYNCASLLPYAIWSAYEQTLSPTEVIVIDDGCTDETTTVVEALRRSLPDSFVYVKKPNGGEASARNHGVSIAQGEFIAFLDQDDTWVPEKLERQLRLFDADRLTALTFTAYNRISGGKRSLVQMPEWSRAPEDALRQLMHGCCITPSTVVVRRDVLNKVGPFDESLWLGSDWEMWLRIASEGYVIEYWAEPLTNYLWHETNMSRDQTKVCEAALTIFPKLFQSGKLPAALQREERRCGARWHLVFACCAYDAGDGSRTRSLLRAAARARLRSARLGWVVMYLRSLHRAHMARRTRANKEGLSALGDGHVPL